MSISKLLFEIEFIGIVGSEEKKWNPYQKAVAKELIREILSDSKYRVVLVSGGCPRGGIDIWAEEIAEELGISTLIFKPEGKKWKDFRKRNILIAQNSDVLHDIEPEGKRSGGTWTYEYFKKKYPKREAYRHEIVETMVIEEE